MRSCLTVSLLVLGLVACGSSDNQGQRYVSGVNSMKDVSTLNTTEKQQLCSSFDSYVSATLDFNSIAYVACIPGAIWTTSTPDACRMNLAKCMALFPKPIAVNATVHSQNACFNSLAQCQATVGQLEGCVDVNVNRALSILGSWTCDRAGDAGLRAMATPDARVCTNVSSPCNQFATVTPE